jgi:hypothetical protein
MSVRAGEHAKKLSTEDGDQELESVRQDNLAYGALIAIGVFMVQPFLTASKLDVSARVCVIAFAAAIPLLSALVLVSEQETFRRRRSSSALVAGAKVVAQAAAFVGIVAGFWHITWIAGVVVIACALVGVVVHSGGWWKLERDRAVSMSGSKHRPSD